MRLGPRFGAKLRSANILLRLPSAQRVIALRAAALAVVVEIGLRTMSLPSLARILGVDGPAGDPEMRSPERRPEDLRATLLVVDGLFQHWPREGLCLRRSLVLGGLLRKHRPVLRIGVAPRNAGVTAHAWIEIAGAVVPEMSGSQPVGFVVLK